MALSPAKPRRLLAPLAVLGLVAVLALAAGCAGRDEGSGTSPSGARDSTTTQGGKAARGDVTIDMKNIQFRPEAASAKVGQTIVWTNSDSVAHTVTKQRGPGPNFDSGTIPPGGTYSQKVKARGTIDYLCTIHPNQTGTLTVR